MPADLGAFLRTMASTPLVWGANDCALTVADWWFLNHGVDPAAHLRGTYSTEQECHAVLDRERGLARLVSRLAVSVGACRSCGGKPGDVGVIRHAGRHLGAIRAPSGRWAVKGETGVVVIKSPKVVLAWSV